MEVPIIGRLRISEYQALIIGLIFLFLESLLRFATFWLPRSIEQYFRNESQRLFSMIFKDERTHHVKLLQHAESFKELVKYWGDYPVEEHIVKTQDHYLLGIQRIPNGRNIPVNEGSIQTKPNERTRRDKMSGFRHEDDGWPPTQNPENVESVFKRCGVPLLAIRHHSEDETFTGDSNAGMSSSSRNTKTSTKKFGRSKSDGSSKNSRSFSPTGHRESKSQKQSKNTRRTEAPSSKSATQQNAGYTKPVVLLYHGLMTCSEIWVCNYEYENRLACLLADAGYDVWF
ncbi:13154_t:CDS:2, partial [Acaulospora morrowiae]